MNACIASSRVASYPYAGARASRSGSSIDHNHGRERRRPDLNMVTRPTMRPLATTSNWARSTVGCRIRLVIGVACNATLSSAAMLSCARLLHN
jgi:hypothetical protein